MDRTQRIKFQARSELEQEEFQKAVEEEIRRLKTKRPWWHYIWPFEITIRWRFKKDES